MSAILFLGAKNSFGKTEYLAGDPQIGQAA